MILTLVTLYAICKGIYVVYLFYYVGLFIMANNTRLGDVHQI